KETAIEACLGIMESIALPVTRSQKGEIAVTLITYTGKSTKRMRVRQRNPGNSRPKGGEFDAEAILGHHACQRGSAPLVINHVRHFGAEFAKSPTQTAYDYRS